MRRRVKPPRPFSITKASAVMKSFSTPRSWKSTTQMTVPPPKVHPASHTRRKASAASGELPPSIS